tara:strand:+ start:1084 stop:2058 length:975 start_codon:yes stop_codon:yes gene_type:complete
MSNLKLGRVNMPKLLRQMRHRTSQVRDLVFIRDPIYRKSTKTTKSGGTLAGPAVNFGYEQDSYAAQSEGTNAAYHADSPELILPGLKCLQSPIVSRQGELERTGHRITGQCTFYAPSLDYILALDNFSETAQFNELETYDKLIDIERVLYTASSYSATNTSHTIKTFDDKSAGYQLDRLQFKIKSGTTLTKIALSGNEGGTTKSLTWSGSLALSSSEYITIDVPLRDIDAGETTSVYKDGVRTELTAGTDNTILDIDKLYGASTYDLLSLVLTTSSGLVELKDIYFYKEAEWRIDAIKDYRDEYMEIGAVRVRGDRGSRRRAYG